MKKLVALDLDGTLLDRKEKCNKKTINYLKKLKNSGNLIVIATGRMLSSSLYPFDNMDFANYVICDSGSGIYDLSEEKFIYKDPISKKLINELILSYGKFFSFIELCSTNDSYIIEEDGETNILEVINNNVDIMHIVIELKKDVDEKSIMSNLTDNMKGLEFQLMKNSFSGNKWFDVLSKGNSKYNSILKIANDEKISNDNIICFGDGLNDIEMIKKCGVGVAMGNAFDDVKKVSNFITKSNDEDGVLVFLEKFFNTF